MNSEDYKAAYLRQKAAREEAEEMLETKSRELFESNTSLKKAYGQLKNQQKHLVAQEKMASLGVLSAGVAHEINNPIGFIKSNIQSLAGYLQTITEGLEHHKNLRLVYRQKAKNNPELLDFINQLELLALNKDIVYIVKDCEKLIKESLEGTERVTDIVKQLRDLSYSGSEIYNYIDINDCISNTLKLLNNEIKYKCEIITEFSDVPMVYANKGEFSQVMLNLILNASQAIQDKGIISLRTLVEDSEVVIEISDNGPGISPDIIDKIFDPFFTTKEIGEGTGLGLSIANTIIDGFGGNIFVNSEPGQGTVFTIRLPVDDALY